MRFGVHEPSASASPCAVALAEGGDETSASAGTRVPADAEIVGEGAEIVGEGPRHIIFDLENISEHEKAAGAKSEGLTLGPCCDYNKGLGSSLSQMWSKINILSITVMY